MTDKNMKIQLYTEATLATMPADGSGYGLTKNGAIAVSDGQIIFVGRSEDLPSFIGDVQTTPLSGKLVTPGLIDAHTHLVYAGNRAQEFEMRQSGASYTEIAEAGGGIISTVAATRAASEEDLIDSALLRLDQMIASGVTTVEIKSGYGLDRETELKMLRVARALASKRKVRVVTTYLGAHAIPKDMNADSYIDTVCIPTLREAAAEGLVDMVDGFLENIAFTPQQITRVFDVAKSLHLPVKLHAEQLSHLDGGELAALYGALSADHLEHLDEKGISAMKQAGTVAMLLPGAFYFLKETKTPPIELLREAGVPMAIATDSNPGSSPMTSLPLAMNMAATLFGLTPTEALMGTTVNAARALGQSNIGSLEKGKRADMAIWDAGHPAELTYRMGDAPLIARIVGGHVC